MTFKRDPALDSPCQAVAHACVARPTVRNYDLADNYFDTLFQNVGDAVLVVDDKGQIVYVNRPACDLADTAPPTLTNSQIGELFALQEDWATIWSRLKRERKYRGHGCICRHNGTRKFVEIQLSADVADGNHLAVFREISNLTLSESKSVLSEKQESVVSVATGVAHELINLLNVIGGHTELLVAKLEAGHAAKSHGQGILTATKQAGLLVSQLAAFGRQQVLSPSIVDLAAFVRSLRGSIRSLVPEDIDLVFAEPSEPVEICVDRTQLCQIVWTLASSVSSVLPQGGTLSCEVKCQEMSSSDPASNCAIPRGRYSILEFANRPQPAVGPDHSRHKVQSEAEQLTDSLRLPSVTSTIQQNHGFFSVNRNSHEIAWRVYFPRTTGRSLATHNEESPVPVGTETILLVEDDPALREVTREYLKSLGYNVFRASNGEEALQTARSIERIDLLITDVRMPKIGGDELAKALVRQRPGIRILFLSGHVRSLSFTRLTEGRTAIFKPFTLRSLANTIRDLLDAPQSMTALALD